MTLCRMISSLDLAIFSKLLLSLLIFFQLTISLYYSLQDQNFIIRIIRFLLRFHAASFYLEVV